MRTDDVFPSKYMKASDLPEEGSQAFTIEKVEVEEIGKEKERKPVVYFHETNKAMVCNKTNWNTLCKLTQAEDSDDWIGVKINLYRAEVEAFGEMVEAIRVSIKPSKATQQPVDNVSREAEDGDPIPF